MFDTYLFKAAIQAKLLKDSLSLRDAAKQTGVSASTLSRMTQGEMVPDIDTFCVLVEWLEMDANAFLHLPAKPTESDAWAMLLHALQELHAPQEMIKAIVTLIRVVRGEA